MIAPDHNGCRQLACCDHFVESKSEAMAVAQTNPADARRKPLKGNPLARHIEPAVQVIIIREEVLHLLVSFVDVLRIT